jgi:hypothetical protein
MNNLNADCLDFPGVEKETQTSSFIAEEAA